MLETKKSFRNYEFMERKFRQPPYLEATMHYCLGPSEAGGRGAHTPQCLADQLALSQPGGRADNAPNLLLTPPRFSDLPKSLLLSARGFPSSILSVSAQGHWK